MAERKRIALIFKVNQNWMGGTYYILNIINALNTFPENEKPEIILLCESENDFLYARNNTNYPHLQFREALKPSINQKIIRILNKLGRVFLNKNLFCYNSFKEKVDAVYPIMNRFQLSSKNNCLYWIPDLQERFLPQFFSEEDMKFRDRQIKEIIQDKGHIIFSSRDALNSFDIFYPEGNTLKKSVFHFVTTIPEKIENAREIIKNKFNAPDNFFYCANQFWVHKNHKLLFEATQILKTRGLSITVFCSGGTHDYRNPEYFPTLQKYISEHNLGENIRLLGFINRNDQLALMQECNAIIQPSLFEGWSTSVEEAKALNKFMILSDIPLHKEQVKRNGFFFERNNAVNLADVIEKFINEKPQVEYSDYNQNISEAAQKFMKIIES